MKYLRFSAAAFALALLLTGCGNRDKGKNDELLPAKEKESEPGKSPPKKDTDKKHTHEPG
jgi:hypothetical protein